MLEDAAGLFPDHRLAEHQQRMRTNLAREKTADVLSFRPINEVVEWVTANPTSGLSEEIFSDAMALHTIASSIPLNDTSLTDSTIACIMALQHLSLLRGIEELAKPATGADFRPPAISALSEGFVRLRLFTLLGQSMLLVLQSRLWSVSSGLVVVSFRGLLVSSSPA